jgi:hypothetical protein
LEINGKHLVVVYFSDRMLRRMFGPRREEITGDWRKTAKRSTL